MEYKPVLRLRGLWILLAFLAFLILVSFLQSCQLLKNSKSGDAVLTIAKPLTESTLENLFGIDSVNLSNVNTVIADTIENKRIAAIFGVNWQKRLGKKHFVFLFEGEASKTDSTKTYLKFVRIKE